MEDSAQIASFRSPPIAEVVTSVSFLPMQAEHFLSFGSFWRDRWSDNFPTFELQAPYNASIESFERVRRGSPAATFGFETVPPLPRVWVTAAAGKELLQVQHNWFAANWRRDTGAKQGGYDRWPARRAAFSQRWHELRAWLEERGHDARPTQCEVTYINHIRPISGLWATHSEADKIVQGLVAGPTASDLEPEQMQLQLQQRIPPGPGLPPWRLHVTLTPAFSGQSAEPTPILVLELTARGAPAEGDLFLAALDRARKIIVESFIKLTTPAAREAWEQE